MFKIKKDSIVEDYIVNSKHTVKCASKEFQIAEECKCWRIEFVKMILANQKELSDLKLVKDKSVEKTLAEQYLEFIQTKWDPKYNFNFGLNDWKKKQTIANTNEYLEYYKTWFSSTDNVEIDEKGKQYITCQNTKFVKQWWEMNANVRHLVNNQHEALYAWDSFVAWCWVDEAPRKAFGIELKEENTEFTVKLPDQVAHIPSVKLGTIFGVQNIPVVQMTTITSNPKARKLKRIKTHSSYVKCTNKSRRVVSTLTGEITCGHCLKLGKKKGLWV